MNREGKIMLLEVLVTTIIAISLPDIKITINEAMKTR